VFYDFNRPEDIPESLRKTFDMVVIDPPFITEEVWRKYGTAGKMLQKEGLSDTGNRTHFPLHPS
jgi:16S rRNA G966 N2-methylase RsmD